MLDEDSQQRDSRAVSSICRPSQLTLVRGQVDLELAEAERPQPAGWRDAPQHRLDARNYLRRCDGLDDVVVAAETEPSDLVGVAVASAQEEDRYGRVTAKATADLEACSSAASRPAAPGRTPALELFAGLAAASGKPHGKPSTSRKSRISSAICSSSSTTRSTPSRSHRRSHDAVSPEPEPAKGSVAPLSSTFHRRLPRLLSGRPSMTRVKLVCSLARRVGGHVPARGRMR